MIFLQSSGLAWTDQGITTMVAVLAGAIFGSYGFGLTILLLHFAFKDAFREFQIELFKQIIPLQDAARARHHVGIVNALEPFVNLSNPFTQRQKELNQYIFAHGIEAIDDPDVVIEFIQAWDHEKNHPDPSVRTAAREILREANAYLAELRARQDPARAEQAVTQSQTLLAAKPKAANWWPWS